MTNPEFDDIELSNVLSYIVGGVLLWHSIDCIFVQPEICFDADDVHGVADCYTCKSSATLKSRYTYVRHAVGDYYARKTTTTRECVVANNRHSVTDCYARKPGHIAEGRKVNVRHAIWNCYTRKSGATIEDITADAH